MPERLVRMVRCFYRAPGDPWVPMGRARTRCPECGAVVVEKDLFERDGRLKAAESYHVVEMRRTEP